jgi:diaminopimelate decarboxylase
MPRKPDHRLPFEMPEIRPLASDAPHANLPDARRPAARPFLGAHRVADLAARFGSPLWVLDEDAMRAACRRLAAAFRARWDDVTIGYSVKTNYLSAVVAIARSEGFWGEVVSGFEYEICRDLGIPGGEIVFNGPWKTDAELRRAFAEGAWVNVDGEDELRRVIAIARELDRPVPVGIRVNMRLNYPPWDKFGFSLENGGALECARVIAREKNLALRGLHMHVGTYVPDSSIYRRAMEALVGIGAKIESDLGCEIRVLDLGGGYATRNTLRGSLLPGESVAATAEDYAEAITKPLRAAARQFRRPPRLVIEPGRIVVDEAVSMVSTVRAVKRTGPAGKAAILDAGVHVLPTAYWYEHEVAPVADHGQALEHYRLAGPLCMQIDVVREGVNLPAVSAGDLLVIRDVGAYNFSQSMQFIQLRPPVILIRGDEAHVVRAAEDAAYARLPESLPPHLMSGETSQSMLFRGVGGRGERASAP